MRRNLVGDGIFDTCLPGAEMTQLIQQRAQSDCMLCCMAMAMGIEYDDLANRLGPGFMTLIRQHGVTDEAEPVLLSTLGLQADIDYRKYSLSPHWCSIQFARNILWGRRALICVRSMNNRDGWHSVYWDGEKLFDPSPKSTYSDLADVEPIEIIVFQERGQ